MLHGVLVGGLDVAASHHRMFISLPCIRPGRNCGLRVPEHNREYNSTKMHSPHYVNICTRGLGVAFGFFLGIANIFGYQASKEPPFVQIERLTVRLEVRNPAGEFISQGTGFFVTNEKRELFIVTARHVVVGSGYLRARVPSLVNSTGKTEMLELRMPEAYWVLGEDGDPTHWPVDVAVMKLSGIQDRQIVSFQYCQSQCPAGGYNQLGDDPHPLDQIVVLGFPLDVGFTLKEQRPIVRSGLVSLSADEEFLKITGDPRYLRKGVYMADVHLFGGNSGGPVLTSIWGQPSRLGGLITASNATLSLGFVTPTSQIRETLDRAASSPANMSAWFLLNEAIAMAH